MFILEGLKANGAFSSSSNPTIDDITSFVANQMKEDEKKRDFLERKLKSSKKLVVIGFESLQPIKLNVIHEYDMNELSELVKFSNQVFDPLFFGYNISNNQYRKLEGQGTEIIKGSPSPNTFTRFYINNKLLDKILPNTLQLQVPTNTGQTTADVLKEFYRLVNQKAAELNNKGEKEPGIDFFVDFNTLKKLENTTQKQTFFDQLVAETGMTITYDYSELEKNEELNKFVYCLETVCHLAEKTDLTVTGKTITDVLDEKVLVPFEMPTNEKPFLRNKRHKSLDNDLPFFTFLEMILFRYLVVLINKQGTTSTSGYYFPLKEGNDEYASVERKVQIVADKNGNISMERFDIQNAKKEKAFKQRIIELAAYYFDEEVDNDQAENRFFASFMRVLDVYFTNQLQEKELIRKQWYERRYKEVGIKIYDGAYRNSMSRIAAYLDKNKKGFQRRDLFHLLFVLDVLNENNRKKKGWLTFMTQSVRVKDLMEKETLTNEEVYYIYGCIAGMVSRNSRNSDSLTKTLIKQSRIEDIKKLINKRFESRIEEIPYVGLIRQWMGKVRGFVNDEKRQMNEHEKFSYITGVLSEMKMTKGDDQNDKN